jgi:hypothetical protein
VLQLFLVPPYHQEDEVPECWLKPEQRLWKIETRVLTIGKLLMKQTQNKIILLRVSHIMVGLCSHCRLYDGSIQNTTGNGKICNDCALILAGPYISDHSEDYEEGEEEVIV